MLFIEKILQPPSYGWKDENGNLYNPSNMQITGEFFRRINIFTNIKNWLPFLSFAIALSFLPFFILFIINQVNHFNWWMLLIAFIYMIMLATHGTIWYHRYCTHQAYTFSNKFWRFITRHLAIKLIPEEIYVVSHHVHHALSDQPGDPYNAQGGFLYCFLADTNHQPIAKDLNEQEYSMLVKLTHHIGLKMNSYKEYLKWGSIVSPMNLITSCVFNWIFWFLVFYLIGGYDLAITIFGITFFWGIGVRTFNYKGHGKGKDERREGIDFNLHDMSINQLWPGFVAGEWHNNHHLYPASARSGFLPHQIDFAWLYIKLLSLIGAVSSYHDSKELFIENYWKPYLTKVSSARNATSLIIICISLSTLSSILS